MKKIVVFILMLFSISVVGCSSNISSKDINEMKEIVDKVLSYENSYDDEVSDYIDEKTFNEFIKYHLSTCERYEMIGAAAHTLDILKKED